MEAKNNNVDIVIEQVYIQKQIDDLKRKTDMIIVTALAFGFLAIALFFIIMR